MDRNVGGGNVYLNMPGSVKVVGRFFVKLHVGES